MFVMPVIGYSDLVEDQTTKDFLTNPLGLVFCDAVFLVLILLAEDCFVRGCSERGDAKARGPVSASLFAVKGKAVAVMWSMAPGKHSPLEEVLVNEEKSDS